MTVRIENSQFGELYKGEDRCEVAFENDLTSLMGDIFPSQLLENVFHPPMRDISLP
ncbi:hypothetical protein [Bacillus sp. V5-8f]|uniref:hypothetical protein n=1 Tax=Bacillus sp. V5-8f TaxID=2053044 RepID=UPI0015E119BB|nr:hypothetical protein [Bacillus sp. V5-8f]